MLKILIYLVLISASFAFLEVPKLKQWFSSDEINAESLEKAEKIQEISQSENKPGSNLDLMSNRFYADEALCEKSIQEYDNLIKTIDNYVQRYINLFLITSNLRDYEVKDLSEVITLDLEISLTAEDLMYLQGYSKSVPVYPKNFSKLDAIFYKIAKQKEKSFLERELRKFSFFQIFDIFSALNNPSLFNFFPLLITLLVTFLIYSFFSKKNILMLIGMIFNSFVFWDSLNSYSKKLKEAEVEIYVKTLELRNAPEKCDPANIRWYDSLLNLFRESQCLEYYKNLNKNAAEEVSLFKCIIDTYSYYLIQTPFRLFGASIRDLTGEISSKWPWPVNLIVGIPLAPFFAISVLFFVFLFYSKRIRLSFFGAAVEIGGEHPFIGHKDIANAKNESQRTVRIIRKLRPWTKSRFSKRMEVDLAKRRKLLKCSRSQIPIENETDVGGTEKDLNNALVIKD